jgi:L-asparaginase/beta-aspartyl-peptidase (threonine type)
VLRPEWLRFDLKRYWNLKAPYREIMRETDTVGAVALSADGIFAVAGSTGGAAPMLRGRIGDTPVIGSGFYAGPQGAVAATGVGEEIMRRTLSLQVYNWIDEGLSPQAACERGVKLMPKGVSAGLIAIGKRGYGVASSVQMASAVSVKQA